MNSTRHRADIPAYILLAAAALLTFSIVSAMLSYQTGIGRTTDAPAPYASRALKFERQTDNSMHVVDANTGSVLERLESADEGFIPGALRGLLFERRRHQKPADASFHLVAVPGEGIALIDKTTGLRVQLEAFGRQNARDIARFLSTRISQNNLGTEN